MLRMIYRSIASFIPPQDIFAHCDVPCGIYDPKAAQTAAATVLKMTQLILEFDKPDKTINDHNKLTRCIMTKEEHAQKCKDELLILWTDYFKPEHLAIFPDLHDTFWKAAKLCSSTKQEVSLQHAQDLVKAVDGIAEMFFATKKV